MAIGKPWNKSGQIATPSLIVPFLSCSLVEYFDV